MKKSFWLILFSFCFSMSINAQVFTSPIPPQINMSNQIWRNFRMGQIGNQMAADMARSRQARKSSPKAGTGIVTKPPAKNYSNVYQKQFAFVRSADSPLAQKLADSQTGDKAANLKTMNSIITYSWGNFEKTFQDENQRLKMPYNDTASAMTYYIVVNYMRVNNLQSLEGEKSVAVYGQIASILAKDASFSQLQSTDKQMLAELLVLMTEMPLINFNRNRNFADLKNSSNENLARIFGTNAGNLKITEDGLEF